MLSVRKSNEPTRPVVAAARFEPRPGAIVADKYRIERVIGEGGMGVVASATHIGLEQRVAIKFLSVDAMKNAEAVERFMREAKVAAKVKSEHVARVHDVGTIEGGGPFLVMEHLDGHDLAKLIAERGALTVEDACEIALQACEALAEVHAAGVVHRDLKPSNLFITAKADGSPCVKLLDFGIAKLSDRGDDGKVEKDLTGSADIIGSPSYMSPEQFKSTKEADARADVWSLGAVLYESLTGVPPFRADTVVAILAKVVSEEPPAPSSLRPELPLDVERVVLRCLEKKPELRATLADLAEVLVGHAPERSKASIERIDALLGRSEPRSQIYSPPREIVLPPESAAGARTLEPASAEQQPTNKRGGGKLFVLAALALVAAGVYVAATNMNAIKQVLPAASVTAIAPSASPSPSTSAAPPSPSPQPTASTDPDDDPAPPPARAQPLPTAKQHNAAATPKPKSKPGKRHHH